MINFTKWTAGLVFLMIISVNGAYAQATRTWVSGVGDDANPCSRTAPCKTFAGAISKTATGGEINAMDSGGFGALTITKAITIDGGANIAGVLVSGTNGIVVTAGASDVVILRNLDINGLGTSPGGSGIRFTSGGMLYIENCTISRFPQYGIDFEPSGVSALSVDRTLVREAAAGGLYVKPGVSGSATATVANSRFANNLFGVRAEAGSDVSISNSIAEANINSGFVTVGSSGPVYMNLESCLSSNNGDCGIISNGANSTIRISNCFVTGNGTGLKSLNSGVIQSFLNNRIIGNTVNGAPTVGKTQQ